MKLKSVPILCSMLCVHWYIIAHLSVWFGEYEETHPPFYPAISAPTEKEITKATVCRLCVCVCLCSSVVWCVCALSVFAKGVLWWWRALEISLYNPISFLIRWCCGGGGVKGEVELGALVKTFAPVLVLLIWLFRDSFGFSTGASCDQSSYPFHRSCRCVSCLCWQQLKSIPHHRSVSQEIINGFDNTTLLQLFRRVAKCLMCIYSSVTLSLFPWLLCPLFFFP